MIILVYLGLFFEFTIYIGSPSPGRAFISFMHKEYPQGAPRTEAKKCTANGSPSGSLDFVYIQRRCGTRPSASNSPRDYPSKYKQNLGRSFLRGLKNTNSPNPD